MSMRTRNRIFDIVVFIIILISVVVCITPFLNVIAVSFSSNTAVISQKVTIYPIDFNTQAYQTVFSDWSMVYSLIYSIILTVVFTVLSMATTILAGLSADEKAPQGPQRIPDADAYNDVFQRRHHPGLHPRQKPQPAQ
jgi:putative aldouronate transport system permease protein